MSLADLAENSADYATCKTNAAEYERPNCKVGKSAVIGYNDLVEYFDDVSTNTGKKRADSINNSGNNTACHSCCGIY